MNARGLWSLRSIGLLSALWLGASAQPPSPPAKTPADFVRAVLPEAARDFAPLRGARLEDLSDNAYTGYRLKVDSTLCRNCDIIDYYGRGSQPETWVSENFYAVDPTNQNILIQVSDAFQVADAAAPDSLSPSDTGMPPGLRRPPPPDWPIDRTEAYLRAELGSLMAGFTLRDTVSPGVFGDQVPTLYWEGAHGVRVEAKMYPQMVLGMVKVALLVGHDLAKSAHTLRPPTPSQVAGMHDGLAKVVRTAVPATPRDFASIRGSPIVEDDVGHAYRVKGSFGSSIRGCEILDLLARLAESFDSTSGSPSALMCSTVPVLGTRAALEGGIRDAIRAALPAGFEVSPADSSFYYDVVWKNGRGVSVALDSGDQTQEEAIVTFTVRIEHLAAGR